MNGDPRLAPIIGLFQAGRGEEGLAALDSFLSTEPEHVEALALAAFCQVGAGNKIAARGFVERAARLAPTHPVALNNLGLLAEEAEASPEVILDLFRRAAAAAPSDTEIAGNLERSLVSKGLALGAMAGTYWEENLRLYPAMAGLWTGCGKQLLDAGDLTGASEAFAGAASLSPERAETRVNLGIVEHRQGRPEEALRRYAEAAVLEGDASSSSLRWNRSLSLLSLGDLENGFADYEARDYLGAYRKLPLPRWNGEPFSGTLLLHAEQGFGDAIQFARYAALAKERGGTVLLACSPPLERLLARVKGVDGIVRASEIDKVAKHCAWEAPLLSLPHIVKTRLETIPAAVPYIDLGPRPERTEGPLHVGLVASGNPKYGNDLRRSIPPSILAPLAAVPGLRWTGFHHDGCPGAWWEEGLAGVGDFYETAQRLRACDLVISVDTASAHLAGALGLPVWVLLPVAPDWRWLRERTDSPWYPTARLFRQPRDGAWAEVVAAVARELATLASA